MKYLKKTWGICTRQDKWLEVRAEKLEKRRLGYIACVGLS
jgi:hypothetical protein